MMKFEKPKLAGTAMVEKHWDLVHSRQLQRAPAGARGVALSSCVADMSNTF